jgi:amino acid transporter
MINVIAVSSLRTLAFSSVYGVSLVFFYLLAAIFFFFPIAFVAAELGTAFPSTGGIYIWVREAFGKKCSFIVIWLSWIYNAIWYPTILALIAGTITYLFSPELASSRIYMSLSVLVLFWLSIWFNLHGMRVSSFISSLGAILGSLLPMLFIAALGVSWILLKKPISPDFFQHDLIPTLGSESNLAFLTAILFGLLGLEMSAIHAAEMKNPQKDYPKAVFVSAFLILVLMVLGSLAIALVLPVKELNLATGAMQGFALFLKAFNLEWAIAFIALAVILGGISAVSAWVLGPTKALMVALQDAKAPAFLIQKNKEGAPSHLLLIQGVFVSILSLAFVIFPSVNSSFWFLSVITAQLALVVYIFLFLAALRLHYHKPDVARSFRVPCGKIGMWVICSMGLFSCISVIALGFLPPSEIVIEHVFSYEAALISCLLLFGLLPLFIFKKLSTKRK